MLRHLTYAIAFALLAGCNSQTDDPAKIQSAAAAPDNDVDHIVDSVARMQAATTEHDRFVAAWPIVLSQTSTTATRQTDTDAPVSLLLELASDPHEWSTCVANRNITDGTDPLTIRIELASFVGAIPWKPTKDVYFKGSFRELGDGESDLLQWCLNENNNEIIQRYTLRFRLKAK
jgi:hypothetical protein